MPTYPLSLSPSLRPPLQFSSSEWYGTEFADFIALRSVTSSPRYSQDLCFTSFSVSLIKYRALLRSMVSATRKRQGGSVVPAPCSGCGNPERTRKSDKKVCGVFDERRTRVPRKRRLCKKGSRIMRKRENWTGITCTFSFAGCWQSSEKIGNFGTRYLSLAAAEEQETKHEKESTEQ